MRSRLFPYLGIMDLLVDVLSDFYSFDGIVLHFKWKGKNAGAERIC